jgi:hypothetical protein
MSIVYTYTQYTGYSVYIYSIYTIDIKCIYIYIFCQYRALLLFHVQHDCMSPYYITINIKLWLKQVYLSLLQDVFAILLWYRTVSDRL